MKKKENAKVARSMEEHRPPLPTAFCRQYTHHGTSPLALSPFRNRDSLTRIASFLFP
jgi:hypothetical protein